MNPGYSAFIELGKTLADRIGLGWDIPLDRSGLAKDRVGWNLTAAAREISPSSRYLRDLGTDSKALNILNAMRADRCLLPLPPKPISAAWQDLIKAAVAEQLFLKRSTVGHVVQSIVRPLKVIATCVESEPWNLGLDELRVAVEVGTKIQHSGKLGDLIVGMSNQVFDAHHICDAGQLYAALEAPRLRSKSAIKARHMWSKDQLRAYLETMKREERLPDRRAFWELTRIVMTERPLTFMDDLRFSAIRVMIVTGLRLGEVALLPVDWKRERKYCDAKGRPASEAGGLSTSLMLRHFAEKQQLAESDSRILHENAQPVPDMFRELLTETLDHAERLTEPLRSTLKLQCETGHLLPWYRNDELVPFTEIYTRLMGNPFWLGIDQNPFIERYKRDFDKSVFFDLHRYQAEVYASGKRGLNEAAYSLGRDLQRKIRDGRSILRFRRADGSIIESKNRIDLHTTYLLAEEIERYVRNETPTKVSDTTPHSIASGVVQPWEFLFVHPIRSVSEERNGGLCDVTRFMAISAPDPLLVGVGLGYKKGVPSLFQKYGKTEADRKLGIRPHMLRHLQNTELFRLGVADTIISKRFNRRSIAQSYDYDHRSLAEDLDHVELPEDVELALGEKASAVAKLIHSGKAHGPIVDAFRRIQAKEGDLSAYEYLRAEADGFHATPYGHCLSSFTVDPCPKHLECFDGCRHLSATNLTENRQNLIRLEGKLKLAVESIRARPSTSIGWQNQIDHAAKRLAGVQKLLATPAGERPFPAGVDLSVPAERGILDE